MSPGDRPSLPLTAEPALFLHPALTGAAAPRGVQPAPGRFGLEEEPALWPGVAGRPVAARRGPRRPAVPRRGAPRPASDILPATGLPSGQTVLAGLALGLAALLRRRDRAR